MSDWCFSLDGCLCFPLKSGLEFFVLLFFDACHALHVARFSGPFSSFHASRALFHFAFLVSLLFSLLIRFLELAFSFLFSFLSLQDSRTLLVLVALGGTAHSSAFYEDHCTCVLWQPDLRPLHKTKYFPLVHCSTRDRHACSNHSRNVSLLEVR